LINGNWLQQVSFSLLHCKTTIERWYRNLGKSDHPVHNGKMMIKILWKVLINFIELLEKATLQESSQMLRFRTFMTIYPRNVTIPPFKTDSITTRLIYTSYILNSTMEKIAKKKALTGSLLIPILIEPKNSIKTW
jgi:hypothetical protein